MTTAACMTPEGRNTNTDIKIQKTTRKLICTLATANSSTYPVSLEGFSVTLAAPKWFLMFATSSCCSLFQPKKLFADIKFSYFHYLPGIRLL